MRRYEIINKQGLVFRIDSHVDIEKITEYIKNKIFYVFVDIHGDKHSIRTSEVTVIRTVTL